VSAGQVGGPLLKIEGDYSAARTGAPHHTRSGQRPEQHGPDQGVLVRHRYLGRE